MLRVSAQVSTPQITAVEPRTAATTPGAKLTVYGVGFSAELSVYIGGLQARGVDFVGPTTLQVVTPYLRPGTYTLQMKAGEDVTRSDVTFTALASSVDADIDRAIALVGKRQDDAAIAILHEISKSNPDPQVRAFAHYETGQIYYSKGDWWRWSGETDAAFDPDSGQAVQTSWRYRLSSSQADYYLPTSNDPTHDLLVADWTVKYDVTQNPEPHFFRGLVNARYGNLEQAKRDSDFILAQEPSNPSYRALAAYIATLRGDKTALQSFSGETTSDARALTLLGEAAFLGGDSLRAGIWWDQAAKIYPLSASLACWAGKKHLARGQQRVAVSLLTECTVIAPNSNEAREAREMLVKLQGPSS